MYVVGPLAVLYQKRVSRRRGMGGVFRLLRICGLGGMVKNPAGAGTVFQIQTHAEAPGGKRGTHDLGNIFPKVGPLDSNLSHRMHQNFLNNFLKVDCPTPLPQGE